MLSAYSLHTPTIIVSFNHYLWSSSVTSHPLLIFTSITLLPSPPPHNLLLNFAPLPHPDHIPKSNIEMLQYSARCSPFLTSRPAPAVFHRTHCPRSSHSGSGSSRPWSHSNPPPHPDLPPLPVSVPVRSVSSACLNEYVCCT